MSNVFGLVAGNADNWYGDYWLVPDTDRIVADDIVDVDRFHYFETLKQSLSLQWLKKDEAPEMLGKLISVGALASLLTYGALWVMLEQLQLSFKWVYGITGGVAFALVVVIAFAFRSLNRKPRRIKVGAAQAILALLRADFHERRAPSDFHRVCGLFDGGKIWLYGC